MILNIRLSPIRCGNMDIGQRIAGICLNYLDADFDLLAEFDLPSQRRITGLDGSRFAAVRLAEREACGATYRVT